MINTKSVRLYSCRYCCVDVVVWTKGNWYSR